ncbi:hypothetical protein IKE80_02280 [Candidatus Saccharibacteria bacterium]|nr:hypothetical protein [Candidatus Saccharibacteria bacterium]
MPIENVRNRGYFKIEGAARAFNFDFRNKVVLDVGSSTGGFTQYALDRGAKKVIAVEKGTNQMVEPLRHDPRVELHEKTDIFDVGIQDDLLEDRKFGRTALSVSERKLSCTPDVILADVSFISLTKILNHLKANFKGQNVDYLIMLKPQFEARPDQLNKGVVKNEKIRREVIKNFEQWLKVNGFIIIKKRDNDLKGKTGNQERFYYLRLAK